MIRRSAPIVGLMMMLVLSATPAVAASDGDDARLPAVVLAADLDGIPIPLTAVAKFYCNDFDYPLIHCFGSAAALGVSIDAAGSLALLSGTDFVQVFDSPSYQGASMVMSQDYPVLAAIGWNDKVGSFKGKNFQTGTFYTDWFGGGTAYGFCCNQQVPSLGAFNNTFSSVYNN